MNNDLKMSGKPSQDILTTSEPRAFADQDVMEPVLYKGELMPFGMAKFWQWSTDFPQWAIEQVFTKDESDRQVKRFPNKAYFWEIMKVIDKNGMVYVPKTRRMMMTHLMLSAWYVWALIFDKLSYNAIITLREATALQHLRDRPLFTLEHLDYRFPYPNLTKRGSSGIMVKSDELLNQEIKSGIYAYPSGSGKGRGMTFSRATFDEFAHQEKQAENYEATVPALEGAHTKGMFISSVEAGTFMEQECADIAEDSPYINIMPGLSYQVNNKGIPVIYLNYLADPDKNPKTKKGREWLEKERAKYSQEQWNKEYEGMWRFPISNRVYTEFKKDYHCKDWQFYSDYDYSKPVHIGVDLGFNYPCFTFAWYDSMGNYVIKQSIMFEHRYLDEDLIEEIHGYLNKELGAGRWQGKDKWYIDPAGKANSGQGTAPPAYRVLRKILKHKRVYFKYTKVEDRITLFNRMLRRGVVKINPNCGIFIDKNGKQHNGHFIAMLEWGYQRKDNKGKNPYKDTDADKDGFYDHPSDSNSYILAVTQMSDIEKIKNDRLKKNDVNKESSRWYSGTTHSDKTNKPKKRTKYKKTTRPFI